jgi:hypothetical protein
VFSAARFCFGGGAGGCGAASVSLAELLEALLLSTDNEDDGCFGGESAGSAPGDSSVSTASSNLVVGITLRFSVCLRTGSPCNTSDMVWLDTKEEYSNSATNKQRASLRIKLSAALTNGRYSQASHSCL